MPPSCKATYPSPTCAPAIRHVLWFPSLKWPDVIIVMNTSTSASQAVMSVYTGYRGGRPGGSGPGTPAQVCAAAPVVTAAIPPPRALPAWIPPHSAVLIGDPVIITSHSALSVSNLGWQLWRGRVACHRVEPPDPHRRASRSCGLGSGRSFTPLCTLGSHIRVWIHLKGRRGKKHVRLYNHVRS